MSESTHRLADRRAFLARTLAGGAAIGLSSKLAFSAPALADSLRRPIPSTGETLPAVGLGTWQQFDPPALDDETRAQLTAVLRTLPGGACVDSSPMYGKAETVAGTLAADARLTERLFLATKVWTRGEAAGVAQMESSLKKLRRDKLDLIQIHNLVDWETHLKTLRAWEAAGRIRYLGITHYQPSAFELMEKILRDHPEIDFVQLPYSVEQREAEKRLLPAAAETRTAVIASLPFGGGGLFAKVRGTPLPDFAKPFAGTWAQAFLKFILADDRVTCAIPGTSDPKHAADNLKAATGRPPTPAEREKLAKLFT